MKDLILVGTSIMQDEEAVLKLVNEVLNHEQFDLLKETIEVLAPFNKNDFKVLDAFAFEGKRENLDESYLKAKGIVLSFNESQIIVHASIGERNQKSVEQFAALVEEKAINHSFLVKLYIENNEVVQVSRKEMNDQMREEILESIENEQFPQNEHYREGMLGGEVTSQVQEISDGCLWGGYRWCGKACNNYKDRGGDETWINETDRCCREHDYCYRIGFYSRATCDANLCSCVQSETTNAATLIRWYYC